jgi:RNA polymerase sigma-70 factor (ECF subfamily)
MNGMRVPTPAGRIEAERAQHLYQASDEQLLKLVAGGQEEAFRVVWDRFGSAVYSFCLARLGDPGAAEDATQEAFIAIWRRACTFDPRRGHAASWLFAVARNAASQVRRGGAGREILLAVLPDDELARGEDMETRLVIHAALTRIPATERQVVELAYFEDLSQTQIAERLRLPLGTVKSRTRSALRRLAECLQDARL